MAAVEVPSSLDIQQGTPSAVTNGFCRNEHRGTKIEGNFETRCFSNLFRCCFSLFHPVHLGKKMKNRKPSFFD